jgi:hypothetical protein
MPWVYNKTIFTCMDAEFYKMFLTGYYSWLCIAILLSDYTVSISAVAPDLEVLKQTFFFSSILNSDLYSF